MDKEVLELLQGMLESIKNLTIEVRELKAGQEELKEELRETNKRLDTLEKGQKEISLRINDISKGIGKLVSDEIGESISSIKEEVKEIKKNVEEISEKVNGIEVVTMKNCYDIAKIKVVK